MKRDWQQRWAKAYDRARARTRRRVDALIAGLEEPDVDLKPLDQLVGEADRFQARVHDLLLNPPSKPISPGGSR